MNEALRQFFEDNERLRYLVVGYIRQTLTEREEDELDQWVSASEANLLLFEELTDEDKLEESLRYLEKINVEKGLRIVRQKAGISGTGKRNFRIWPYGIAATILLAIGLFIFWPGKNQKGVTKDGPVADLPADIAPGRDKAILVTGNGQSISLSDSLTGFSGAEQGTRFVKTAAGELVYQPDAATATISSAVLHTLRTPAGGQFKVVLPDGSVVWLNAASSLQFPTVFTGTERRVQLTGEAFFEVKRDDSKPFRVLLADSSRVEVLGTRFNIMHYPDESTQQTTLVEGSVKLAVKGKEQLLRPGEQVQVHPSGKLLLLRGVDTESVTAWKNGHFSFHDASIETIMRQVARWYDAEIIYQGKISHSFTADVSRHEPVSKLLRLLELTNRVHFTINQNKIYVQP